MNEFFLITDKLMKLNGFKKPGQLIEWLEVKQSTFYTWRRRKKYSFEGIISFSQRKNLSLHWLFWDEGSPFRSTLKEDNLLLGDKINKLISFLEDKGSLIESIFLLLKERSFPNKKDLVKIGGNENSR